MRLVKDIVGGCSAIRPPRAGQKVESVKMGQMRTMLRTALLCCLLALGGGAALPVYAQGGFAVQVAAVQTRAEAEAMTNSLRARGLSAYWVKADVPGKGTYYRVRIGGQFTNNRSATEFGQKLQTAGVIRTYAVFKYDAPTTALDEQTADKPASHTGVKPPAAAPRTAKNTPGTGQAERPQEKPLQAMNNGGPRQPTNASYQPPSTDYLISGSPIPASESETASAGNNPAVAPARQPTLIANPSTSASKTDGAKAKHSDEVELDDFIEFSKVLRGTVEVQAGRLQVTLQNTNKRYRFRGKVNLTFIENGREAPQAPMQIEIAPAQEQSFEVTPTVGGKGNYVLAVYDEQGALQLMQSGALNALTNHSVIAEQRQTKPQPPAPTGQTGDVPPLPPLEVIQGGGVLVANDGRTDAAPPGSSEGEDRRTEPQNEPSLPGDVKIIPRKVSETAENITLEFEILSQQPLGMITLALRTASVNEAKQGIMTTKQGRLPFLVPLGDTNGAFSYELKNEQGVLLAAGQMSFQQLRRVE
jgi:hypothetical protein